MFQSRNFFRKKRNIELITDYCTSTGNMSKDKVHGFRMIAKLFSYGEPIVKKDRIRIKRSNRLDEIVMKTSN